jgi:uncharacterized protein YodC (DUF2158 family)
MADQVAIGETVRLKSGGPHMTVDSGLQQNNKVYCTWFDKDDKHNRQPFSVAALMKVNAS